MEEVYVLDTSIVVDARIIELVEKGEVRGKIVIPKAVIAELEHQANRNKEVGFAGFSTIRKLREYEAKGLITVVIEGERPSPLQIINAKSTGEIDALIREVAKIYNAVLVTGDKVQHEAAEAEGIKTLYLHAKEEIKERLEFEKYFEKNTMSIHIKENDFVKAKVGSPGNWKLIKLDDKLSIEDVRRISEEIIEVSKRNRNFYFEIDKEGATVIQMGEYRIVIAKPPFSDGFEITIVRPIKKLKLEDYNIDEKLLSRLEERAEGILICGPPGSGKSTFATALAEYYAKKGKIVKTMEDPRDMKVVNEITQYSKLDGSFENTKDILLLVRPDYTFYDEVRKAVDFKIYADMRMAGIGLVGVVHAKKAIDAIQRFIDKVELGIIPQIVDTVILIDKGKVSKVYYLEQVIKVPTGMTERDLARPVIEVRDFYNDKIEFEIYKFGEETVVLDLSKSRRFGKDKVLESVRRSLKRMLSYNFELERVGDKLILRADSRDIPKLFKKHKKKFEKLNKKIPIEVREL